MGVFRVHTVLLVDSDAATALMYGLGLERAGFQVEIDPSFDRLFAGFTELADAIVMEWEYLRIPAVETITRIRSDRTWKKVPVLVLTNADGELKRLTEEAQQASAQGWHVTAQTPPYALAMSISENLTARF